MRPWPDQPERAASEASLVPKFDRFWLNHRMLEALMFFIVLSVIISAVSGAMTFFDSETAKVFWKYGLMIGFGIAVLAVLSKGREDRKRNREWKRLKELCLKTALTMKAFEVWDSLLSSEATQLGDFLKKHHGDGPFRLSRDHERWLLSFKPPEGEEYFNWIDGKLSD